MSKNFETSNDSFSLAQKIKAARGIASLGLVFPLLGTLSSCGNIPDDDIIASQYMDDFSDTFVNTNGNPSSLQITDGVSPEFAPKTDGNTLRVATFNVLGDSHTDINGNKPELQSGHERMIGTIALLNSYDIDIVGLQEFQPSQWSAFDSNANKEYGIFPNQKNYPLSANSIVYKKNRIKILPSSGDVGGLQYLNGRPLTIPSVNFIDLETGVEYTGINTHDPASATKNTVNSQDYRLNNAKKYRKLTKRLTRAGKNVLLLGDFNSNGDVRPNKDVGQTRNDLAYCKITKNRDMLLAYDVYHGNSGHCPSGHMPLIDHIYVSSGVGVDRFGVDVISERFGVSDHPLVFADISPKPN